jgi:hypothetical protein
MPAERGLTWGERIEAFVVGILIGLALIALT